MVVVNQTNGLYEIREKNLTQYAEKVKALTKQFRSFNLEHVPRLKNKRADTLGKLASSTFRHLSKKVLVEIVKAKVIEEIPVMTITTETSDWKKPII